MDKATGQNTPGIVRNDRFTELDSSKLEVSRFLFRQTIDFIQ